MPTDRAELLRTLRLRRGLSQSDLASLCGLSLSTVQAIERGADRDVYPSNIRRLFAGLNSLQPLSRVDARAFAAAFDYEVPGTESEIQEREPRNAELLPLEESALAELHTLTRLVGDEAAAAMLRSLVIAAKTMRAPSSPAASSEPHTVRVIEPPVQRTGYTEQVIREFERVKPASPPAAHTKGKHKRG